LRLGRGCLRIRLVLPASGPFSSRDIAGLAGIVPAQLGLALRIIAEYGRSMAARRLSTSSKRTLISVMANPFRGLYLA
jgi:hypothetical protein